MHVDGTYDEVFAYCQRGLEYGIRLDYSHLELSYIMEVLDFVFSSGRVICPDDEDGEKFRLQQVQALFRERKVDGEGHSWFPKDQVLVIFGQRHESGEAGNGVLSGEKTTLAVQGQLRQLGGNYENDWTNQGVASLHQSVLTTLSGPGSWVMNISNMNALFTH
jgi:hypothetical protein